MLARTHALALLTLLGPLSIGCGDLVGELGRTRSGQDFVSASDISASDLAQNEVASLRAARTLESELDEHAADGGDVGSAHDEASTEGQDPGEADGGIAVELDTSSLGDDAVRCGDGVLDADELCDISIAAGEPGACPEECPSAPAGCPALMLDVRTCWSACVPSAPSDDPACLGS